MKSGSQSQTCTTFIPTFPSGCPFLSASSYCTVERFSHAPPASVGATQDVTETAASFSAGGFSNIFARPSYQTADVASYLSALGSTNSGLFNSTSRGYPDVSAQGVSVEIVNGGE